MERSTGRQNLVCVDPRLRGHQDSQGPSNVSRSRSQTQAQRRRRGRRPRALLEKARQGGPRTPLHGGRCPRCLARRRRSQAARADAGEGAGTVHPHSLERFTQGTLARFRPLSTRSPFSIGPQREGSRDHEEPTAILRPSGDARPLLTYSRRLSSTRGPPVSPERHSRS